MRATAHGSSSRSAAATERASSSSAASISASTLIAMSPRNRSAIASVQSSPNAVPSAIARSSACVASVYSASQYRASPIPASARASRTAPGVLRPGERERSLVEVHRRAALQTTPGAVARLDQGVERAVLGLPVRRVQVAGSERGEPRGARPPTSPRRLLQALRDLRVQTAHARASASSRTRRRAGCHAGTARRATSPQTSRRAR